ncbi:hypothetical protein [uncultured Christiangramia sp.]|uniref:hypothetical protein n=1 Tax=Christiangramia sp. 3-2217-3z TaxID=3417564 RepID=UPI00262C0F61|nr:hypothetical protein [uncultured Christiangramia sp.]
MNKRLFGFSLSAILLFASCEKSSISDETSQESDFSIADASELSSAINFNETGVIGFASISNNRNSDASTVFGIEQIASLEAPEVDGVKLRATHVDVKGDLAYVSYNKEGATYLGAVDVINIQDKYNPVLVNRMTSTVADINSLFVDNNNVLVITGASAKENRGTGNRTMMAYFNLENGNLPSTLVQEVDDIRVEVNYNLDFGNSGNAGVHVLPIDGEAIAISGDAGAITRFEYPGMITAFEGISTEEIGDLRYAALKNNTLAVLSGVDGLMNFNVAEGFTLNSQISTAALSAESKRTIAWYGDNILVSEGSEGVGIYSFESNSKVGSLPLKMHPDAATISTEDAVTNAVSTDGNYVYMANGGAGLDILKLGEDLTPLAEGIAEIEGSANFVQAKGEYIYVASGKGLKILRIISLEDAPNNSPEEFLSCSDYPVFDGNKNLTITPSTTESYSGVMNVKNLNVNGTLNFCGTLMIEKSANLSSGGEMNVSGAMYLGNNRSAENLTITSGSTLRVNGMVEIHGDLNIQSNGKLEFVGEGSKIYVGGTVKVHDGGALEGEFEDLNDRF